MHPIVIIAGPCRLIQMSGVASRDVLAELECAVARQVGHSCGDLIFSSHTTFALSGALTYTEYGSWQLSKVSKLITIPPVFDGVSLPCDDG